MVIRAGMGDKDLVLDSKRKSRTSAKQAADKIVESNRRRLFKNGDRQMHCPPLKAAKMKPIVSKDH